MLSGCFFQSPSHSVPVRLAMPFPSASHASGGEGGSRYLTV